MKQNNSKPISNVSMTKCHKGGIKIKETNNNYSNDPFANVNPFNVVEEKKREEINYNSQLYNKLDLNIDNYSRDDIYKLFGLKYIYLNEDIIKECKKIVLKTHPDKCRLDNKYFLFFTKAYKKLLTIYEFQNKTKNTKIDNNEYYDSNNSVILDKMFDMNSELKKPKNFNIWFNEQFEKHRLEDPVETGYGNWLKSDEDIVFTPTNISKDKIATEMEKRKKEVQTICSYTGLNDSYSSTFGGSSLMNYNNNFTSDTLFTSDGMGYTDLRQAYVESVIPITEEDFQKREKFNSLDEYKSKRDRDTKNILIYKPEESMRQLYHQNKQKDEESSALAFYYAQQTEKAKNNENNFWSEIKQVTNW
jgi:hypothetical protein